METDPQYVTGRTKPAQAPSRSGLGAGGSGRGRLHGKPDTCPGFARRHPRPESTGCL